jgi:acetoin utilization deacetylase AcuC-like enzyme
MTTAILTHPDCAQHEMGEGHPESPMRLKAILAALESWTSAKLTTRGATGWRGIWSAYLQAHVDYGLWGPGAGLRLSDARP